MHEVPALVVQIVILQEGAKNRGLVLFFAEVELPVAVEEDRLHGPCDNTHGATFILEMGQEVE